mgnify:CR=1 FL=1
MKFEKLSEKLSICVSEEHGFGTDAFLLTHFCEYKANDIACDLGTGCGIIPMIMQRVKPPKVTFALDIQKKGAPLGKCSLVTCNPPYKAADSGIESELDAHRIARHEIMCNIYDVCRAASRLLKFGGRLCLCNRPERLGDVIDAMKKNDMEPKRLRFVSKNPQSAPWLFLIEGKKGSKPYLKVLPQLYVWTENGYTDEMQKIYSFGLEEGAE